MTPPGYRVQPLRRPLRCRGSGCSTPKRCPSKATACGWLHRTRIRVRARETGALRVAGAARRDRRRERRAIGARHGGAAARDRLGVAELPRARRTLLVSACRRGRHATPRRRAAAAAAGSLGTLALLSLVAIARRARRRSRARADAAGRARAASQPWVEALDDARRCARPTPTRTGVTPLASAPARCGATWPAASASPSSR